jgi:cytochrome c551
MGTRISAFTLLAIVVLAAVVAAGCGQSSSPAAAVTNGSTVITGDLSGAGGSTGAVSGATGSSAPGSSTSAADLALGKSIFAANCARCHGTNGQGARGPNLHNETDLTKVMNQVTNGGQIMPSFSGQLSDAQINAVAQFVLSLAGS